MPTNGPPPRGLPEEEVIKLVGGDVSVSPRPLCNDRLSDNNDWMLNRSYFLKLESQFGPFDYDCCCDDSGHNSHVYGKFFSPSRSFLVQDISGNNVFINPPFDNIYKFLAHYFHNKAKNPSTSGVFVLPNWTSTSWFRDFVPRLTHVQTVPSGSWVFTRPSSTSPGARESVGPTRWDVNFYRDPPILPPHPTPATSTAMVTDGNLGSPLPTVRGKIGNSNATFLIDSGATHNFVSPKLHLRTSASSPLRVQLADGSFRTSTTSTSTTFYLNGKSFQSDFVILDISGCDVILGQPFLRRFNPHINWARGDMQFKCGSLCKFFTSTHQPRVALIKAKKVRRLIYTDNSTDVFVAMVQAHSLPHASSDYSELLSRCPSSKLRDVLQRYAPMFDPPTTLPPHRAHDHAIDLLPDSTPPPRKLYRMSTSELAEVKRQLADYISKGWIRPSSSPFGAPILFVRKKTGELRMCVDYRELNKVTRKNRAPLPRVDEMFDMLYGSSVFSSFDLYSGYNQLRIREGDEHKTAFQTRYGLYEFLVLPFGLCNAPSTFMTWMNDVLRDFIDDFVLVYLDDILIYSRNVSEHVNHVDRVLQRLSSLDLKLKASKCFLALHELTFLGHIVSSNGIRPDPSKVQAVLDWPLPSSLQEIRSFLGFVNYYRKFIPNFATIAAPLVALTSTTSPQCGVMNDSAASSFKALKLCLSQAPTLAFPHVSSDAEFVLDTDASDVGIGYVLHQLQDGCLRPLSYGARTLNRHERNYSVQEKELLAIVDAFKAYRCYFDGCAKITVRCDHSSLASFLSHKNLTGRRARWAAFLQPYAHIMDIHYVSGSSNVAADALSRRPSVSMLSSTVSSDILSAVSSSYAVDDLYNGTLRLPDFISEHDDLYYFGNRLCVPSNTDLRRRLFSESHDSPTSGHGGVRATYDRLSANFWWPHMLNDVRRWIKFCPRCQLAKTDNSRRPGLLQPHATPPRPFHTMSTDLVTDLPLSNGFDTIIVFVCLLTKRAFFIPTRKQLSAEGAARLFLRNVFPSTGLPRVLISDRDVRFTSSFWSTLFKSLGTTLKLSTAFHPETDGQSERVIQHLLVLIRTLCHPYRDDWYHKLPLIEFAYNSTVHSSTKCSPFQACYGFQPVTPMDVVLPSTDSTSPDLTQHIQDLQALHADVQCEVERSHALQARQANLHRRPLTFRINDLVKLKTDNLRLPSLRSTKVKDKFCGPFRILDIKSPVSYQLDLPASFGKTHNWFHVDLLRPYHADSSTDSLPPSLPMTTPSPNRVVSSILDVKFNDDSTQLLFNVRYAPPHHRATKDWLPLDDLRDSSALHDFLSTSTWRAFRLQSSFRSFASQFPLQVP